MYKGYKIYKNIIDFDRPILSNSVWRWLTSSVKIDNILYIFLYGLYIYYYNN